MKFGKHLQKRQLDIPEYAASFVNYKALKKLIKQLAGGQKPSESAHYESSPPQAVLQANKATFFFRLDREIEKVNAFYLQKEEELNLRLRTLLEKKRMMQLRAEAAPETPATFLSLQEGFRTFGNDLNKLLQFVELNAMAFSKILKKWDKFSKSRTKELYLSRAVEVQPCFNRDVISELSDQATTNSLELEAWAEGEKLFTTKLHEYRSNESNKTQGVPSHDADVDILQTITTGDKSQLLETISRIKNNPQLSENVSRFFISAIHDASEENLTIFMESLLVDMHYQDEINHRNCLHEAAISGKLGVITYALSKGVKPDSKDVHGRIPLHYACMHGYTEAANALLTNMPSTIDSVDHDNFTPLIHAIFRQTIPCAKLCLERNAKINPENDQDYVPLNFACQHGFVEIAEMLLFKGARITADAEGLYPQHLVARHGHDPRLFILLKDYGADINEVDRLNQWTALFHAASEGHLECLKALLDGGARTDILDENGYSAMYYSVWEGNLECAQILYEAGKGSDVLKSSFSEGHSSPKTSSAMNIDSDGIPDLSLPPPILPLRRYGHNFLDNKIFVQLAFEERNGNPVHFFQDGKYPASRLTISSKSSDLIPRNLLLPLSEDTKKVTFQIDSLESFSVEFDVFPTFGTKMIAKTVALSQIFNAADTFGHCILPLFDSRTRAIGQLSFDYLIVKPFLGVPMEISHFATYWKATSQFDSHPLITGSSLSGEYLRVHVQVTRDLVPVVSSDLRIQFEGMKIPTHSVNFQEFQHIGTRLMGNPKERLMQSLNNFTSLGNLHTMLSTSFLSLAEFLDALDPSIHLDVNIIYPSVEDINFGRNIPELNNYVDSILNVVFDHSQKLRQNSVDSLRAIMFSSYDPSICTAVNWKQPTFPVFFCNNFDSQENLPESSESIMRLTQKTNNVSNPMSLKEAVRFAKSNNLMGLICSSVVLEMVPALIQSVKVEGLVIVSASEFIDTHTEHNSGLDGLLRKDGVLEFNETIDI